MADVLPQVLLAVFQGYSLYQLIYPNAVPLTLIL
jgi:hypothetical protein